MASSSYSKSGNSTKCDVTVYYTQNAESASFYFTYVGYCAAGWINTGTGSAHYGFYGNDAGYIRMDVDGTYTTKYTYAGAKAYDKSASGGGWIQDKSGTSDTITLPGKNTPYNITVRWTGTFGATQSLPITYSFTLPIYINPDGTVKAVSKAYLNVGGSIKECTVFVNVGGTVKQLT